MKKGIRLQKNESKDRNVTRDKRGQGPGRERRGFWKAVGNTSGWTGIRDIDPRLARDTVWMGNSLGMQTGRCV